MKMRAQELQKVLKFPYCVGLLTVRQSPMPEMFASISMSPAVHRWLYIEHEFGCHGPSSKALSLTSNALSFI